ncbi:glycerol kinase [Vibrio sp. D420a]|uniref:glycerol kinase n=1 Tax=Vibrio sp. D420a TaxID=2836895 RepID=UPI0025559BEF|nr:glycerol kinase [Vibrio sp. D420a]MDK9761309.1 glycerol kinase [Vibrio sp. D420a]
MTSDKLSTSALAKLKDLEPKILFSQLKSAGYIVRGRDKWVLTERGEAFGGEYVDHTKFGQFIVWPENLLIDTASTAGITLTATQLGQSLQLSAKKINLLLNELGWIRREDDGWHITNTGLKVGGEQREDKATNNAFVVWHDTVAKNKRLKQSVVEFLGKDAESHSTDVSFSSFRQKFEAKHRTLDGHYVRSKGELIIDNWLYMAGVVHAYERPLPIATEIVSDFYLPSGKVYIQFWGSDKGAIDNKQKETTQKVYKEHGFDLIEIYPEDIPNLDSVLPPLLRQFGIKAY